MPSPIVWKVMPALSITPKITFFGLDKQSAHCFTIDQRLHHSFDDPEIGGWLGISPNRKQVPVRFLIRGREYPAELRLAIQDRSKPRIHEADDLPERRIYQFQWYKFDQTIAAIKDMFWDAYEQIVGGNKNHEHRIVFYHLGDNVFMLYPSKNGQEYSSTLMHRNQA